MNVTTQCTVRSYRQVTLFCDACAVGCVLAFPDLGFVSRMISLFVSLIFIALVVLVVFPDWIERLLTSEQQNQPDLENRQQDDEP